MAPSQFTLHIIRPIHESTPLPIATEFLFAANTVVRDLAVEIFNDSPEGFLLYSK